MAAIACIRARFHVLWPFQQPRLCQENPEELDTLCKVGTNQIFAIDHGSDL